MGDNDQEPHVRPIKFKVLSEDHHHQESSETRRRSTQDSDDLVEDYENSKRPNFRSNFTFEISYPAVVFENVCFSVDRSKQQANIFDSFLYQAKNLTSFCRSSADRQQVDILKSVNLSVPYGSIFGLLGPSSCGKTTLLRCLVGLLKPSSGFIRLFCRNTKETDPRDASTCCCLGCFRSSESRSNESLSTGCRVPGSNVGYMPQDLGLYEDFTIRQLLTMFGQYMKMSPKLIANRIDFMSGFLDLPNVDREISSLSGGQKRRVSFAIACLHMPPLIILDEPTVGVDPLLRQSIWKYLRRLADEENKTIIITTHYIEEAAQADQVALMRAGEILVQDTPARIMESNGSKSLEEAFLKICNNVDKNLEEFKAPELQRTYKLYEQPKFNLQDDFEVPKKLCYENTLCDTQSEIISGEDVQKLNQNSPITKQLKEVDVSSGKSPIPTNRALSLEMQAKEKLAMFDSLISARAAESPMDYHTHRHNAKSQAINKLSMAPNIIARQPNPTDLSHSSDRGSSNYLSSVSKKVRLFRGTKIVLNESAAKLDIAEEDLGSAALPAYVRLRKKVHESLMLWWALLYKNYRRNVNSLPLLAFQFMLPIVQMISFSLCVGGRPSDVGLGLINHDQLMGPRAEANISTTAMFLLNSPPNNETLEDFSIEENELLSLRYLSFIDHSMLTVKNYNSLREALNDVRKAKLWAVMEIGENFTSTISKRFDLDNFYQLDPGVIQQSVIKLYPDRSNKVLDMICHRSLVNSYRAFILSQFEHFKRLPIEVKEPIFDIKPNLISNSIDGYTESIAAGLLASLTYIMAAGLTTFIMVVERSAGILERTYTSGINPVAYLIAHAAFRSLVMMIQIAVVLFLTFYILKQPLVGSIWLAYIMLMTLNLTGISYGLLISSLVTDQNGAALTIVSSLVVKITLSGILWPFEAIPRWLRSICYIQPLTMPIQALKAITLKGAGLGDRVVQLGFLVSVTWLVLFLFISAKRFKFYQH